MINEKSNYYFRFPDEINDRLDFTHYHHDLDELDYLDELTTYDILEFGGNIDDKDIVVNIVSGSTPNGIEYLDDGVLFLGAGNVQIEKLDLYNAKKIDYSYHEGALFSSSLELNDILISKKGTVGRCCVFDLEDEANINENIAKVKINEELKDHVIEKYISEFLNSYYGQLGFTKYMHESVQYSINLDEIKRIKIILPPKDIQEAILSEIGPIEADATENNLKFQSSIDNANTKLLEELDIESNEEDLFFKKGKHENSDFFLVFSEDMYDRLHYLFYHPKYNILESLQSKYKTILLKDICKEPIKRGKQPHYENSGIMVIKTIDLKNRYIGYDNTLRVSEEFFESKTEAHVQKGDLLIASTGQGSLGKVDVFDIDTPAMVDAHISIIRLKDEYDPYFIAYYLRSPLGQIQFEKWFSGSSGQIEIQPGDINNFILPSGENIPFNTQKEIASRITELYQEAGKYEKKSQEKWAEARELFESRIRN